MFFGNSGNSKKSKWQQRRSLLAKDCNSGNSGNSKFHIYTNEYENGKS